MDWKKVGGVSLSALMVVAAFPPLAWWPLALFAWWPLIWSIDGLEGRTAFRLGLWHGFLVWAGTLSWLWHLFGPASVGLWLIFALFTAFWALFYTWGRSWRPGWRVLAGAVLWVGIEYFRSELFVLKFPWITPGTALPPGLLTPICGVYGVSFLVLLVAGFSQWNRPLAAFCALALGASVLGGRLKSSEESAQELSVALVQSESLFYEDYLERSQVLAGEFDVIVWPEYALDFDPRHHPKVERDLAALLRGKTRLLVFGARQDEPDGAWRNTSFAYGREGVLGTHVKNHPVHFFDDGVAGERAEAVSSPLGGFGMPICFDNDYQDVVRRMTRDGAACFFVPSMDGAHWSAREHEQHGMLFRHRAAENGRWMAVASTSGVTQIIDEHGRVRERLPLMAEGVLRGKLELRSGLTFYQRAGWLCGPVFAGAVPLLLAALAWSRYRDRRKQERA
ncbi:MAG: apolipoprotein N-acyltransferase [Verrucomicrobiales bacterium]